MMSDHKKIHFLDKCLRKIHKCQRDINRCFSTFSYMRTGEDRRIISGVIYYRSEIKTLFIVQYM